MTRKAPLCEQDRYFACMVEPFFVTVDVQDAFLLQIEINAFFLRPGKQVLTRGHSHARRFDRVAFVVRHGRNELSKPGEFVPGRRGVDQ